MKQYLNIRTGVIGIGSMGKNHVRILKEISNLVAISDLDSDLGNQISKEYDIPFFQDYRDMVKLVDAVQ